MMTAKTRVLRGLKHFGFELLAVFMKYLKNMLSVQ